MAARRPPFFFFILVAAKLFGAFVKADALEGFGFDPIRKRPLLTGAGFAAVDIHLTFTSNVLSLGVHMASASPPQGGKLFKG
ncbi:hypothetical protein A3C20_01045 [Candidatus Kaiserbacteria bacterium RIFCSPHIGHO2_02_FULL_55_25]|uniref:Uncharacterized protein n=1 Tax=Candidatus Kaiserbacteria bacterium RIFCSPHIGHO2_02_FULL_55_25 TaxID=1798498 RepID=A0A1F6E8N5_9BACT|nr:MAG: hypothetical protein A3C20_01045 [Candidatus Kaiserbacteria bacterium RIFCSPHIGHO2_02_FULL_55_25]OGG77363.1 MAG: hypothetical protein A3F56_03985 [Candidatus Kaiserbacteria bacterium RIFCSPHIGHO2_12_FULL_55_13]OGG82627.1 MAG: hypothetical protein A3A42_00810 [Candidatus Kaiserbacteria bacterium RIFCSPLOWO2_01_FULL_55_25]